MPSRNTDILHTGVSNVSTSTNRNAVTPEMRAAYQQVLREKEKIIEDIAKVKEELRITGLDNEELVQEDARISERMKSIVKDVKSDQPETQSMMNPNKIHPVGMSIQTPPPRHSLSVEDLEALIAPLSHLASKHSNIQSLPTTPTEREIASTNERVPTPPTAPVIRPVAHNPRRVDVDRNKYAKEVAEYDSFSDNALMVQRELHMEIAAMHLAIQQRTCLAGGFIVFLLLLLIFF